MTRLSIQLPVTLKAKVDALREQGITASGFIRSLIAQHFNKAQSSRKGR